jgi:hypothetical protein
MLSARFPRFAFSFPIVLAACSSSGEKGAPGEPSPPDCTSAAAVCLDVPEGGFKLETKGTTIGPGEDVQYCEVVEIPGAPGEPIFVSAIDGKMTPYSHHLNAMIVVPGSPADLATSPGDFAPCLNNGRDPFGSGLREIFTMGTPENHMTLPDGIGHRLEGGQKVVMNYHYFNASVDTVPARAALAFHTTEAANVERELRRFGLYNIGIEIPEKSRARFTSECKMSQDIEIMSLWRHTHRWGTDFSVWRTGGTADGEHVFTKTDWEHDITFTPESPFVIRKDEGLRFECAFENTTDAPLAFGELANDEMCILYGYFVGTGPGLAGPEDCVITAATEGTVTEGFACTQCPDGE